jgi:ABC-type sugar transport system ATPase subunit
MTISASFSLKMMPILIAVIDTDSTRAKVTSQKNRQPLVLSTQMPELLRLENGQRNSYRIRPESLREGEFGISGVVAVVAPTGAETHVVVRFDTRDAIAVIRERVGFCLGDTLSLVPDVKSVHVFDADSGLRMV